jgi:hypothetical protein
MRKRRYNVKQETLKQNRSRNITLRQLIVAITIALILGGVIGAGTSLALPKTVTADAPKLYDRQVLVRNEKARSYQWATVKGLCPAWEDLSDQTPEDVFGGFTKSAAEIELYVEAARTSNIETALMLLADQVPESEYRYDAQARLLELSAGMSCENDIRK